LKAGRQGRWKAWRQGGWEAKRLRGWKAGKLEGLEDELGVDFRFWNGDFGFNVFYRFY
jgi:hypothetical protein